MKTLSSVLIGLILPLSFLGTSEDKHVLKFATIAPRGIVYAKYIYRMRKELARKSGGRLILKIYAGGTAGAERTIVRKMKIGKIDMAAYTGIGLGYLLPKIRILDVPFMFKNNRQIDYVVKRLYPTLQKDFKAKGYILAGVSEIGWVYLMSKSPIRKFDDLKGMKIFAPVGDKMVKAMFKEFSVVPVYLTIESVLPQLQTGGVDAIFAPPVGAIGLQWHNSLKYITNVRINNFSSANVIKKSSYDKLPPDLQKLLLSTSEKYSRKLVKAVRKANKKGMKVLQKRGLKLVEVNKKDLASFKKKSAIVGRKLVRQGMYTQQFLNEVYKHRKSYR